MSQDILSDNLNEIMNAKRAKKAEAALTKSNKLFREVLEIVKKKGYVSYEIDEKNKKVTVNFEKLRKIKAIKPRFNVTSEEIEKYVRRYLPARGYGFLIISTSKGIITNDAAQEKRIGGALIAYFF